jgi:hypothetical protein
MPTIPLDDPAARDDAAWPAQARASRISMRPLTALLVVVLVATVAVMAGAKLQQREGTTASASAATGATRFAGFANRTGGTGGFGGAGGTSAGGTTTGTVTQVSKKLLYLTSATGALVKVRLTSATTFIRTAKSAVGGMTLGDTAIVRGTKDAGGVLVATNVIVTAKGVTSTFGGGGFGGAAAGTPPAGAQTGG